jgi:MFS family permease
MPDALKSIPPGTGYALAITFGAQLVMALPVTGASVLAPRVAPALGVAPSMLGVYMGVLWAGATVASMASGALLARIAPVRALQLCLVAVVLGAFLTATGNLLLMALGALLMGFGAGPEVPASVQLLTRLTTSGNRGLVFAVKHTGWTFGSALVGALGPLLTAAIGWQGCVAVFAAACAVAVLALEPGRRRFDPDHVAFVPPRGAVFESLRAIARSAPLRRITIVAVVLTVAFNAYMGFLVSLFVIELGYSLALAGTIFSIGNLGAIVGRIGAGSIAGRWIEPGALLLAIGFGMAGLAAVVGMATPQWPVVAVAMAAVLLGMVGGGWLGVCLAEIARLAPPDQVGLVTGGVLVFHYTTIIVAPLSFAAIAGGFGYGWGFLSVAAITVVGLLPVLLPARR